MSGEGLIVSPLITEKGTAVGAEANQQVVAVGLQDLHVGDHATQRRTRRLAVALAGMELAHPQRDARAGLGGGGHRHR